MTTKTRSMQHTLQRYWSAQGITSVLVTWDDTFTGTSLPRWKSVIASGGDATTYASGFRRNVFHIGSQTYFKKMKDGAPWFGATESAYGNLTASAPSHLSLSSQLSSALNQCLGIIVKQAESKITPATGGVFLGELRKTIQMVRKPAVAARELVDSYLGKLKKASPRLSSAQRRRLLSSSYLEFKFGWTPLANDVRSGIKALRELQEDEPRSWFMIKASKELKSVARSPTSMGLNYATLEVDRVTVRTDSVRVRAKFGMSSGVHPIAIGEKFGLLPENFLPTAWELIPYSFLIDYFSNVGNIITAACQIQRHLLWANKTERTVLDSSRACVADISTGTYATDAEFVTLTPGSTHIKDTTFERQSLASIVPSLELRLPDLGSWQALNIAALAHQGSVRRPFY